MRSTDGETPREDLTTQARIRDAAIELFGSEGFSVPIRAIAARAGVSAGLILHHFGSKAGLHAACDSYVLDETRHASTLAFAPQPDFSTLTAKAGDHGRMLDYVVRSLREGSSFAQAYAERAVADTLDGLRAGVAAGVVRPSDDEEARARAIVTISLGSLVVDAALHPAPPGASGATVLLGYLRRMTLPSTELMTYGLFQGDAVLDATRSYLASLPEES